jgi:hypothetical protein
VATNELEKLASAVERHTASDGEHDTAMRALWLYRYSAPTDLLAVVYEPSRQLSTYTSRVSRRLARSSTRSGFASRKPGV